MRCSSVRLATLLATAILTPTLIGTLSAGAAQKAPSASEGWIKVSPADAATAAAFAVVDNPTMYDVYLVSASSDIASEVVFGDANRAGTAPAAIKEVTAPAYGKVELKPEGLHLVLKGLKRPLKAGETVALTLMTDGGVAIPVTAIVKTQ
jgi:copper(I)-binding protein